MDNKIIFLIVSIILIFLLFSKTGTQVIKRAIGVVKDAQNDVANGTTNNTTTNQSMQVPSNNNNTIVSGVMM